MTTHYSVGTPILLTYRNNCWRRADYNSNTTYSAMSVAEMRTGTATSARSIRADYLKTFLSTLGGTNLTLTHSGSEPYLQLNHDPSGITAGTYGNNSQQTPSYGGTFNIPYFTVDAQGHITNASTTTVKIPASDNTDYKVRQTPINSNDNNNYRILLSNSANDTSEDSISKKNANLIYNPTENKLSTGNIKLTGELDITGNVYLRNQTAVDNLTTGSLIVNGNSTFNNDINFTQGAVKWTSNSLPAVTSADYFLVIDGFANGGATKYITKANAIKSLINSSAIGSSTKPVYWTGSAFSAITSYSGAAALTGTPTAPTAAAGTSTTQIATTEFVTNAVAQGFVANDAMVFKGLIGSNQLITQLPTSGYNAGWTYRVANAGIFAGEYCEVGDLLIAINDGPASGGSVINADWGKVEHNIDGAVFRGSGASNSSVGSSTQPVYVNGSGIVTAINYTIDKSVPSNAIFTDTLVKQTEKTDNVNYKILMTTSNSPTSGNASEAAYDTGITINPSTHTLQTGRYFHNVVSFETTRTPKEILIKTKIPFITRVGMPKIIFHMNNYSNGTPTELALVFYVLEEAFINYGVTSNSTHRPVVTLSTYEENSTDYVAIGLGLIGTANYPYGYHTRFNVDVLDIWREDNRNYCNGWTIIENTTTSTIIPTANRVTLSYKDSANQVENNLILKIKSGTTEGTDCYTFNGSAAKTLDILQGTGITLTAAANSLTIANAGVIGVKGNSETSYRTGNVNITPANILGSSSTDKFWRGDNTWSNLIRNAHSKSLSTFVAIAGSDDAWNKAGNYNFAISNSNNMMVFNIGGTNNDRNAYIQVGHNSPDYYGNITGNLYLNKLGGQVYINENYAARVTSATDSGQVMVADGTTGGIKTTGYTIATSVPSGAVFTDRYVNSATFADDSTNTAASPVKMTLTRAGSDTATVTANIPKVSNSSAGVVPKGATVSSQTQTTKFLREDGTWAAPSYTINTNTDTLVKQTAKSDNKNYKILFTTSDSPTSGNANEAAYDTSITINPSTHTLTATNLKGILSTQDLKRPTGLRGLNDVTLQPLVSTARANRLAFLPADQIIIEKTTDGGEHWTDAGVSDVTKLELFSETRTNVYLPLIEGKRNILCGLRITITAMKYNVPDGTPETEKYNYWNSTYVNRTERYCQLKDMYFWLSSVNDSIGVTVQRATGANPNSWSTIFNDSNFYMTGWSGCNYINFSQNLFGGLTNQTTQYWNYRITLMTKGVNGTNTMATSSTTTQQSIAEIRGYGDTVWAVANNYMSKDHIYSFDANQNTTFPANVSATKFIGSLQGNADTATTAGGITSAGTTAQFWRGDNTWSNVLAQTTATTLGIDTNSKIGTAIRTLHIATKYSGAGAGITEGDSAGLTFGISTAAYAGIYYQSSGNYGSRLYFATTNNFASGSYARMMITHDGKIGIGTTSPSTRLHVAGDVTVTGLNASQAVATDANKKLVSKDLTTADLAASGTDSRTDITYIAAISQNAIGKIEATKFTMRNATTTQSGVTKLNSATNSTSTTEAATPSAVKSAYDLADNHKYWANVEATSTAQYDKEPVVKTVTVGNGSGAIAPTKKVQLVYDASLETLNFVFS